jgi:hypothetical protein
MQRTEGRKRHYIPPPIRQVRGLYRPVIVEIEIVIRDR